MRRRRSTAVRWIGALLAGGMAAMGCGRGEPPSVVHGRVTPSAEPAMDVATAAPASAYDDVMDERSARRDEPAGTSSDLPDGAPSHLPLFERFPALARSLPVAPIGAWPTAVTRHPEVAAALGLGELWIKRDDWSAEPYGGGKPRKLELLLGAARAQGRDTIVTFGGVGSHHALATAIYAPRHGLKAVLLLLPQPRSEEVRKVLMGSHRAGAELVMAGSMTAARQIAESRRAARPERVAIVAPGGSEPLGNVGFVSAGYELAAQIEAGDLPEPDVIYLALGTMGSAIGLDIGLAAAGRPIPIVAVRASSRPISTWKKLSRMYRDTARFLRTRDPSFPEVELDPRRLIVEDGFLGGGYAQPTAAGRAAISFGAAHDLGLEATYTAKAFAALRAAARTSRQGQRVLFWQSHAADVPEVDDVDPSSLPAAFRGWVVPRGPG